MDYKKNHQADLYIHFLCQVRPQKAGTDPCSRHNLFTSSSFHWPKLVKQHREWLLHPHNLLLTLAGTLPSKIKLIHSYILWGWCWDNMPAAQYNRRQLFRVKLDSSVERVGCKKENEGWAQRSSQSRGSRVNLTCGISFNWKSEWVTESDISKPRGS